MSKTNADPSIRLRGVRHNNLKNFDLDLPLGRLIVITGLSGSGKSSLAFDTLYAEGQRRYIETFSPYARQFFDRMDKPQVDRIDGIPPAIAIEQRNTVKTTRSTVGTMTEICDHMKLLWPHLARLHCRQCGQPVRKEPPQAVWEKVNAECGMQNAECLITFDLPLSEKLSLPESLGLVAKQGYQRLLVGSEIIRIDEAATHSAFRAPYTALTIIQDRLKPTAATRARFIEACEQAYHYGQGKLAIHRPGVTPVPHFALRTPHFFSAGFHCAACDLDYREPTPALFSYNHPIGACPACKGFGRVISIDYHLALPDRSKPLAGGCVKPWQTGHGLESQADLMKFCKKRKVPVDIPFAALPKEAQDWVIHGDPDYGQDSAHEWPRAWYGVKGYFRWLESKSYKMHVRVLLSRYRAYTTCPDCHGRRFNADSLLYQFTNDDLRFTSASPETPTARKSSFVNRKFTLADFYQLSIEDALAVLERLSAHSALRTPHSAFEIVLTEVRARLRYLVEVGLGYLTLDRPTRTLSGGETSRVNLTTCLGTRLVNTLFVLDEPSVGLHPRDTARLVRILENLRDAGNTVVVVEHEASVMRAADQIIDLGPGQGEAGGEIMFQGTFADLLQSDRSLTGQYLSGRKQIEVPERRPVSLVAADVRRLTSNSEALALNETPIPYRATSDLTPALSPGEREKHSPPMFDSETAPTTERAKLSPRRKASLPLPGGEGRGEGEPGNSIFAVPVLTITNAALHNLKNLTIAIPLHCFVCLTGVSGSGKTTLIRDLLLPALEENLRSKISDQKSPDQPDSDEREDDTPHAPRPASSLTGWQHLSQVVLVDQSPLGKTPRSNPAVYIGAFEDLRELFAATELAKQRGLNASAFSFNSGVGQCERCRGAGFEKIEMQFLSDIFIRCPDCHGRRYREHILEVKLCGQRPGKVLSAQCPVPSVQSPATAPPLSTEHFPTGHWSIADLLEATVDDALQFLTSFTHLPAGRRAESSLKLLQEVGLGYLRLGQPINTLSGGESQRLKLVSHLAESPQRRTGVAPVSNLDSGQFHKPTETDGDRRDACPTLFLFDEPTTGLHFDDVRGLLKVFQRLVDAGHSLLVIEHNLDVIKSSDWVIDLGSEAGERGGQLVAAGTPEEVAQCEASHTGRFLREVLGAGRESEKAGRWEIKPKTGATHTLTFPPAHLPTRLPTPLELACTLWNYHRAASTPRPADVIIGLGSYDLRVARHCAQLFQQSLAPILLFTGAQGNFTRGKWSKSEAEMFADEAVAAGVARENILIEPRATNTGDNLRFSGQLLESRGYRPETILLVAKSQMLRRSLATAAIAWPDVTVIASAPPHSFDEQPTPDHPLDDLINEMVGDLQRIIEYPRLGYQTPQELPAEVLAAYHELIARGYTRHLLSPPPPRPSADAISIRGAREHNLKNLSLDIPRGQFVVVTGVSGSGKSTLAFDLIFAEGQRRFLDSMSTYARQFVEQLARPEVDLITGLPPTVSIEQRTTRGGGKSTVATVTEVYHFLRLLFARLGTQFCPDCQKPVEAQTRDQLARGLQAEMKMRGDLLLLAPVVRNRKGFHTDVAEWAAKHGHQEIRADGKIFDTSQPFRLDRFKEHDVEIVTGVLDFGVPPSGGRASKASRKSKARKTEPPEGGTPNRTPQQLIDETLALGHGTLFALDNHGKISIHSTERACPGCGRSFEPLDPKMFSYNSAQGWCPKCRGFGELFYLPDVERGANADAIEESWWGWQEGKREACPECHGARLNPVARAVRLQISERKLKITNPSIDDFSQLAVAAAADLFQRLKFKGRAAAIARDILPEIAERLKFLREVGLGYLQLGRGVTTLSGGEAQRIRLAAQLGSNLSGVLYVLDEPTIGLHARDNVQLLAALEQLQARGNSLLVVEHDEETMRRADYIIDLGPGAGVHGGELVAGGTLTELMQHENSITGQCLRAQEVKKYPSRGKRRPVVLECGDLSPPSLRRDLARRVSRRVAKQKGGDQSPHSKITLHHAAINNLKDLTVQFPLNRLVVVTGVSGSGKSTLIRECLFPALQTALKRKIRNSKPQTQKTLTGHQSLKAVYEVDQSPIGRTPRSTPATYVGFFDEIRRLYADTPEARMRGYTTSRFSFNSAQGRCPACEGAGNIKLEMNFLPPAFVRCETCGGSRFNRETLDIEHRGKNIAHALDLSVEEAVEFFGPFQKIRRPLEALRDTGLGYLKLGQTSPTLSGGEAQRVKLVTHLLTGLKEQLPLPNENKKGNLFILEEPTIGLHISDVRRLVEMLQRLVDAGHSVIVIEHNLDLIAEADWVIDLGPEAGAAGGEVVAAGTPEEVARVKRSHTGKFLRGQFRL